MQIYLDILRFNWHGEIGCSCDFNLKNFTAQGGKTHPKSQKGKMPFIYSNSCLIPSCHRGHGEPCCAGSKVHEKQVCKWQVVGK